MKRFTKLFRKGSEARKIVLLCIALIHFSGIYAQENPSIKGTLIEKKTNEPMPYSTVALIRISDSTMINGSVSDEHGVFNITPVIPGNYLLRVSAIGYKPAIRSIAVRNKGITEAGIIYIEDSTMVLKEVTIVSDRVKAKSEGDKTTFYMTKKILDATNTGTDVLKLIPGIQVDFGQNISLEGSRNIQIFVDGKERDASFVSQLAPGLIERVEIISKPTSDYDGNSTGAINIILKKEHNSGVSGQIYAEIPTSCSEIYVRPNYSVNWGFKNLNLYTSYKGELTYLDLHENTIRKEWDCNGKNVITSNQYVRQKDWSHRFSYGLDYSINPHDQLSFYGFYNPWSRELDGDADSRISGTINNQWNARKEDTDINAGTFYSLDYKHNFTREGRVLAIEISNYHMKANNSTTYIPEGNENLPTQINTSEPKQNVLSMKVDYTSPFAKQLDFSTGIKTRYQVLQDGCLPGFYYDEKIFAAYGSLTWKHAKCFLNMGLRAEESAVKLKDHFNSQELSFFPDATFNYKYSSRQSIQLSYSRSITRPNVYQLNPITTIDDPFTVIKGNPFLKPEFRNSIFIEYSIRVKTNYIATRLFYNRMNRVINDLTFINDTGAFETQVQNMGNIHQFGIQISGTMKLGILTINPFLQIFDLYSSGNSLAKYYGIENRHNLAYNSGLSAILSFRHDISASLVFQYASPKNDIQSNSFSGALYFLTLEKTFKQNVKIGVACALPFTKSFAYQGSEINGSNFSSRYEGDVQVSNPFCWLKLSYQFNTGKRKEAIVHAPEEIDNLPKKGF